MYEYVEKGREKNIFILCVFNERFSMGIICSLIKLVKNLLNYREYFDTFPFSNIMISLRNNLKRWRGHINNFLFLIMHTAINEPAIYDESRNSVIHYGDSIQLTELRVS